MRKRRPRAFAARGEMVDRLIGDSCHLTPLRAERQATRRHGLARGEADLRALQVEAAAALLDPKLLGRPR